MMERGCLHAEGNIIFVNSKKGYSLSCPCVNEKVGSSRITGKLIQMGQRKELAELPV